MTFWARFVYGDPGLAFWAMCAVFALGGLLGAGLDALRRRRHG